MFILTLTWHWPVFKARFQSLFFCLSFLKWSFKDSRMGLGNEDGTMELHVYPLKMGQQTHPVFPLNSGVSFLGPEILFFFCEIEGIFGENIIRWLIDDVRKTHPHMYFEKNCHGLPILIGCQCMTPYIHTSHGTKSHRWGHVLGLSTSGSCSCFFVAVFCSHLFFHPRYSMSCMAYSYTSIWVV